MGVIDWARCSLCYFRGFRWLEFWTKVNYRVSNVDSVALDSSDYSFATNTVPMILVTNRTVRQFMNIQFVFENNKNQPFGLIEFSIKYRTNSQYRGG